MTGSSSASTGAYPTIPGVVVTGERTRVDAARQVAGPDTFVGPLPTALVVLRNGQTTRNRAFCSKFNAIPTAEQALAQASTAPNLILTRWPVAEQAFTKADTERCDRLVQEYDHERAGILIGQVGADKFDGPGPYLVEILPDGHVNVADASALETGEEYAIFVETWRKALHAQSLTIAGAKAADVAAAAPDAGKSVTLKAADGAVKAATDGKKAKGGLGSAFYKVADFFFGLFPAIQPGVKIVKGVIGTVCDATDLHSPGAAASGNSTS